MQLVMPAAQASSKLASLQVTTVNTRWGVVQSRSELKARRGSSPATQPQLHAVPLRSGAGQVAVLAGSSVHLLTVDVSSYQVCFCASR